MILEKNRKLLCCFTVDTDADQFFGSRLAHRNPDDKAIIGWEGLDRGKDAIIQATAVTADHLQTALPITWFVRCDGQIEKKHGCAAFLLKHYHDWWHSRRLAGDDIQWHVHLHHQIGGTWVQSTSQEVIRADLASSFYAFRAEKLNPIAVRVGEAYQSNFLMQLLDEMGLKAECSAMPGRWRFDDEKKIDWRITPNHPYHPSRTDYRSNDADSLAIWEVPMNTVPTQVSYDRQPLLRYVNPAFHPKVLKSGLHGFAGQADFLVMIMHPYEILSDFYCDADNRQHPLISFEAKAIVDNLIAFHQAVTEAGRHLCFVTVTQLIDALNQTNE